MSAADLGHFAGLFHLGREGGGRCERCRELETPWVVRLNLVEGGTTDLVLCPDCVADLLDDVRVQ